MPERPLPAGLIPHRGLALLVQAIVDAGPDSAVCRGRIPSESAFATGGRAPAVVAIELAAQAAAVHQALAAPPAGAARAGYLVSVRQAALHADEVATDAPLLAAVRRTSQVGPLATYEVAVSGPGGEEILTATIGTHTGD